MRRPRETRKLHKGSRYTTPGAMIIIVAIIIIGILVINGMGISDRYTLIAIAFFVLIFALPVLHTKFRSNVWVGENPRVYHAKKGCNGASNILTRSEAQDRGLEPCSKCHRVQGMNRR